MLVWLSIEDNAQESMFVADQMPEIDQALRAAAEENGVPVTLPLWDLTDQQGLNLDDLVTGNGERIRQASARYETDAVLAGRLSHRPREVGMQAGGFTSRIWMRLGKGTSPISPEHSIGTSGAYTRLAERFILAPRKKRPGAKNRGPFVSRCDR